MTFNALEEGAILDHFVANLSAPVFGDLYLHLLEGYAVGGPNMPFPVGGGPTCEGYVPQLIVAGRWSISSGGLVCNLDIASFPMATADWTITVGGWMLADVEGHWVVASTTNQIRYILAGEQVVFNPGDLRILQDAGEPLYRGHFTNYSEDKIMDHMFGNVPYPSQEVWLGLLAADPTDDGFYIGNEVSDVGTGYGRVPVPPAGWWHPGGSLEPQLITNLYEVTFPIASTSWGTVTYFALFDSPTYGTGNILIYGVLGIGIDAWVEWYHHGGPVPVPVEYTINPGQRMRVDPLDLGIWFSR